MNIVEVAKNCSEIMKSQSIYCPVCGEKQFSPLDKLFTKAYEKCIDCTPSDDLEGMSENIFRIIESSDIGEW